MRVGKKINFTDLPLDAPCRRRLPPLLRKAWYGLNQVFRRRIQRSGATPDQFTMLRMLIEGPAEGLTQRELCVLMSSDPNTVAALLRRMEEMGLIERRPHEKDRRAYRVCARPKGVRLYKKLRAIALELQGVILACLPVARRERFLEDLETVASVCAAEAGRDKRLQRGGAENENKRKLRVLRARCVSALK